jgi:PIN domain nuclease of toxin-antitoxin system
MILLDSHVLLWVLTGRRRLGPTATAALAASNVIYVSAATVLELAIKEMLGKLTLPDGFEGRLEQQGLRMLDISAAHAAGIRGFRELARHDPFDRVLLAQAVAERLTLLTADRALLAMGHPQVVDATV